MAQAAKAQEPSMEEILASIRRIIADDEAKPPAAAAVRPAPPPPPPEAVAAPPPEPEPEPEPWAPEPELPSAADSAIEEPAPAVLDLTEDMTAGEEAPAFQTVAAEPDVVFAEAEPEPEPEPEQEPQESASVSPPPIRDDRLLSGSTTAAVDAAFSSLAHTILLNNPRTLEDLVREMLRPMLKTWLDDNLPGLVERMVRAEIERVSRGR
jgi:cell pole-organizing protein PopZ